MEHAIPRAFYFNDLLMAIRKSNLEEYYPYLRQRKEGFFTIKYLWGHGHKSSSHPADG
jgi:hypothetical protein